jgi:hypothetical protein
MKKRIPQNKKKLLLKIIFLHMFSMMGKENLSQLRKSFLDSPKRKLLTI